MWPRADDGDDDGDGDGPRNGKIKLVVGCSARARAGAPDGWCFVVLVLCVWLGWDRRRRWGGPLFSEACARANKRAWRLSFFWADVVFWGDSNARGKSTALRAIVGNAVRLLVMVWGAGGGVGAQTPRGDGELKTKKTNWDVCTLRMGCVNESLSLALSLWRWNVCVCVCCESALKEREIEWFSLSLSKFGGERRSLSGRERAARSLSENQ